LNILLTNDDGVFAPGLNLLAKELATIAKINVVAPDRDRSGASNSLTLSRPLRAKCLENGYLMVEGTPTDCVHLAITGLLAEQPDMVVAGINAGANLGDDVLYSGTVAAAMEGRFLGLPAMAISLALKENFHYTTAAYVAKKLIQNLQLKALPAQTILSVNIPDLPLTEIQGFEITRLGKRHKSEPVTKCQDPRGQAIYWVGSSGAIADASAGTDFDAIHRGYVSITPLHIDLTHYRVFDQLVGWVNDIKL
jgi:5'-nucleotidase